MRACSPLIALMLLPLLACGGASTPDKSAKAAPAKPSSAAARKAAANRASAQAQTAEATPKPGTADTPAPAQEAYIYQAAGRRDPFVNLLGAGTEPRVAGKRGEGAAGLSVNEISVRGVAGAPGRLIAQIQGPDGKSYIIRPGDKLMDGVVKSIIPQGLVIVQEVNDPLSTAKQREVRKLLRSLEDAKQ
jgi:hypothetical protein